MFIDITVTVTPQMILDARKHADNVLDGHLGTHFDVMNKEFPLEYIEREGIVFDVSEVENKEIVAEDIDLEKVEPDTFVAFYSGFIEAEGYGGKKYFTEHPQLSDELIDALLDKSVSIIGVDFAGVRRGKEHTPKDQYCADRGVFIVENLCNLKEVLCGAKSKNFVANTYPVNYLAMTGLPCRVVAKV
jgi:kynurenine formamidase